MKRSKRGNLIGCCRRQLTSMLRSDWLEGSLTVRNCFQVESVLEKSRGLGEAEGFEGGQQPERSPSKVTFSEEEQVTN